MELYTKAPFVWTIKENKICIGRTGSICHVRARNDSDVEPDERSEEQKTSNQSKFPIVDGRHGGKGLSAS